MAKWNSHDEKFILVDDILIMAISGVFSCTLSCCFYDPHGSTGAGDDACAFFGLPSRIIIVAAETAI